MSLLMGIWLVRSSNVGGGMRYSFGHLETIVQDATLDQVEDEGWVDKIAVLGFWAYFTSYVYKL